MVVWALVTGMPPYSGILLHPVVRRPLLRLVEAVGTGVTLLMLGLELVRPSKVPMEGTLPSR